MTPRRIAKALALVGAVALAAILITTVWIVHRRNAAEALRTVADLAPGALFHARHFHWTQMKAGERQWQLTAADARYANDRASLTLTGATLSMTASDGKKVVVQAARADLKLVGNHVTEAILGGGLRIDYGDLVITTQKAIFVPDHDELDAPGEVRIEGRGMKVSGIGLKSHPKQREFALESQVSTELIPHQSEASAPL